MKLLCRNTLTGLTPLYPADYEEKKKLKIGEDYEVDIKRPRNIGHHRKFFALLNLGHNNTRLDMPFETYRKYIIMKAGFFNVYVTPKGDFYDAKSISFGSMPQDEFDDLYSRCLDVIIKDIGSTSEEIQNALVDFF